MTVNVQIPLDMNAHAYLAVNRQSVEHMVEKADPRVNIGISFAVKRNFNANIGLFGLSHNAPLADLISHQVSLP